MIGQSEGGVKVAYPDFTYSVTAQYWNEQLAALENKVEFDGVYLDNNEIANYCPDGAGECPGSSPTPDPDPEPQMNENEPPYNPQDNYGGKLTNGTISLDAQHTFKPELEELKELFTEYNMHSLHGIYSTKVTKDVLTGNKEFLHHNSRQFVLSQSTFPGSGKYGGHWTANTDATWADLQYSVQSMLAMNTFGVPLTGSDIGGFYGGLDDELMARWMQLSVFTPLARSVYSHETDSKELYSMNEPWRDTAKEATKQRMEYLRYQYTLMF